MIRCFSVTSPEERSNRFLQPSGDSTYTLADRLGQAALPEFKPMKKIDLKKFKTADHRILRDINEVIVLNIIRERQPVSRVYISETTGLEEGTISRIVQRFLQQGLVYESGVGASTPAGGRKPRFLHINPTKRCAIGVDIGAVETLLALSDLNGHLQQLKRIPNTRNPQQVLLSVADEVLSASSVWPSLTMNSEESASASSDCWTSKKGPSWPAKTWGGARMSKLAGFYDPESAETFPSTSKMAPDSRL